MVMWDNAAALGPRITVNHNISYHILSSYTRKTSERMFTVPHFQPYPAAPIYLHPSHIKCSSLICFIPNPSFCLQCLKPVDGSYMCQECGWPMCDKKCAKGRSHEIECSTLKAATKKVNFFHSWLIIEKVFGQGMLNSGGC